MSERRHTKENCDTLSVAACCFKLTFRLKSQLYLLERVNHLFDFDNHKTSSSFKPIK